MSWRISSLAKVSALRFGNDGWNFKYDEQAIASCTKPSCQRKAAKTARKLSANPAGRARLGVTVEASPVTVFSFGSILAASPSDESRWKLFWTLCDGASDKAGLFSVFSGDEHD